MKDPHAALFENLEDLKDLQNDYSKVLANLHYTHFSLMDAYKKILKPYKLSFTQSHVLSIIYHFNPNPVTLQQIKQMILEPNSDVSRTVDRLVEKGFVEKIKNKDNRRMRSIKVTAAGKKLIKILEKERQFSDLLQNISINEAKSFITILSKFRENKAQIVK